MFILDKGSVKIYVESEKGSDVSVKHPHCVFGEVALFRQCERMADVQAASFCVV